MKIVPNTEYGQMIDGQAGKRPAVVKKAQDDLAADLKAAAKITDPTLRTLIENILKRQLRLMKRG